MKNKNNIKNASAGRLINEISRAGHICFQHEFKKFNIGHAQIRTLLYIAQNDGKTQKELAEFLNLDKSSITSQLQILEKNGYINREKSKLDARKQVINPTSKTQEIMPSLQQVLLSWTETLLEGFDDNERAKIFKYLQKMRINAQNKLSSIYKVKLDNC